MQTYKEDGQACLDAQFCMAIEEMSELTKEICKVRRGKVERTPLMLLRMKLQM